MRYWRKRGGTPQGIPTDLAPVPISPAMALWLRIDEDLIGGTDDAGCYHRPEALAAALPEWEEPIRVWLERIGGYSPLTSREEVFRVARKMLRQLGAGRADAYAEEREAMATASGIKKGKPQDAPPESRVNRGKKS